MSAKELNDLAFNFVESKVVLTASLILKYLLDEGGSKNDVDYFIIFIKHWMDIKQNLRWSDILFDMDKLTK